VFAARIRQIVAFSAAISSSEPWWRVGIILLFYWLMY
jgi:hypothetical protein